MPTLRPARPRRPAVESLELRWLPSGLGVQPAAEVSVLAAKSKPLVLNGNLRGTTSLPAPTSGIQYASLIASGRIAKTKLSINATIRLDLITTRGSIATLTFNATKNTKHALLRLQVTVQDSNVLSYRIASGTGFLKGSTGSGTITPLLPQGSPQGTKPVPVVLKFAAAQS